MEYHRPLTPIIHNTDQLATTPLRKDALDILEHGFEAVRTDRVVRNALVMKGDEICLPTENICLTDYERIYYVGIGKCAVDASHAFEEILGDRITDGVVLDVKSGIFQKFRSFVGTHPFPSEQNIGPTQEIVRMIEQTGEKDLVFVVVSGGGSSLLCLPHDTECDALQQITEALWRKGATIGEVNTLRKHLSDIQGGQFAKIAYPSTVVSFIFSDVPGDDIGLVASGPTVRDTTTVADAVAILRKHEVLPLLEELGLKLVETPKEEEYFSRVRNLLLVTNKVALNAMRDRAAELGYSAHVQATGVEGIARNFGAALAASPTPHRTCLLYGGETTVIVEGSGVGGRNQEVALGALALMPPGKVVVACASDGWDNTDSAGAIADSEMCRVAERRNVSIDKALRDNDAYHFWKSVGGMIETGKTGINVADFYLVLKE